MTEKALEKEIQKQIVDYLLLKGVMLLRINSIVAKIGPRYIRSVIRCGDEFETGVSDLIGCTKYGRFIAIEVKRPGEKPTKEQTHFLNRIRDNGGIAILAYSVEEVRGRLEAESNQRNSEAKKQTSEVPEARRSKLRPQSERAL